MVSTSYWYFERLWSYKLIIYIILVRCRIIISRLSAGFISITKWYFVYIINKTLYIILWSWCWITSFSLITTFYRNWWLIILIFHIGLILAWTWCIIGNFLLISTFNRYRPIWSCNIYIILIWSWCLISFIFIIFNSHISTFYNFFLWIFNVILIRSWCSFLFFFTISL